MPSVSGFTQAVLALNTAFAKQDRDAFMAARERLIDCVAEQTRMEVDQDRQPLPSTVEQARRNVLARMSHPLSAGRGCDEQTVDALIDAVQQSSRQGEKK